MADRVPSVRFSHAPTMLIRTAPTTLSVSDPLKKAFRSLFEVLPYHSRGHVVAALGEFIGTMIFIFMAFSAAQVASISSNNTKKGNIDTSIQEVTPQELLFIALGVGFSLAVAAWVFFRISGGLFNPVVSHEILLSTPSFILDNVKLTSYVRQISVGMGLIGALTWARVATLCVVQTIAAIVAAYMVDAIFPGDLNVGTVLHPNVSIAQGVIIEMLLTGQLVFTVFMLAAEKHDATFIAPVGIGLSGFIAELIGKTCPIHVEIQTVDTSRRCVLDWRLPEPSTFPCPSYCYARLPSLSLDLLGRTNGGGHYRSVALQTHQGVGIRDRTR